MSDVHFEQPITIPSLDGIRAIAVLLVIMGHSGLYQRRCLAFLVAGVAAIGGAELAAEPPLAIPDDRIEHYLAPSRIYLRFGHDIRVNRYGMRSDDFDTATVDRGASFSVLGDSVVYGNRLDQADTVPARLQKLLTATTEHEKKALVKPWRIPISNARSGQDVGKQKTFL